MNATKLVLYFPFEVLEERTSSPFVNLVVYSHALGALTHDYTIGMCVCVPKHLKGL